MLCPDCRRQVTRGAAFCGSCGAPLGGGRPAARARAGGRGARAAGRRRGDRPRAGVDAAARRPERLAHARAHLGRQRRPGSRTRARATGRSSTARGSTGRCALRDGARIRVGDQELRVERRRERAEAGRTIVVRPGASLVVGGRRAPAWRRRRRSSACGRACAPATRSSAWRPTRARAAGCCATSRATPTCGCSDNDAQLFELLDGSRSLVDLIGEVRAALRRDGRGAARAAARRPRRARLPRRRRGRAGRGGAAGVVLAAAGHAAREGGPGLGPLLRRALPARRLGALHAPGAVADRGAVRRRRRRVRRADRAALRDAVRGRRARSGSAGSSSCSAASSSSPCTRPRTGWRWPRSGGASRRPG